MTSSRRVVEGSRCVDFELCPDTIAESTLVDYADA